MSLYIVLGIFVAVVGYLAVARSWKYSFADCVFLFGLLMLVWFRSRLDHAVSFVALGRVWMGITWAMLALGVAGLAWSLLRRHPPFRLGWSGLTWVAVLMLVSMATTAVMTTFTPTEGVLDAFYANLIWMSAFIGAIGLVAVIPPGEEHHERMIRSYVLVFGYLVPLLMIAMFFLPIQLADFFQWDVTEEMTGGGFTRVGSPLGSGISAGLLVVFAVALAIAQITRGRNVWFYAPVLSVGLVAILLTLARSVVLALGLFLLLFFSQLLSKYMRRVWGAVALLLILMGPVVGVLASEYDLTHLTESEDVSSLLRYNSAIGASKEFLESPLLGYGVNQVYHEVRIRVEGDTSLYTLVVGGEYSALEPHNAYLLILMEYGLVGMTIFVVGAVLWLRKLWQAQHQSGHSWRWISSAYWSAALAWLAFMLTNSDPILYTKVSVGVWVIVFMGLHNAEAVTHRVLSVR